MISSVSNSTPHIPNRLTRAGQAVSNQSSAVARSEESVLRAIDQIAAGDRRTGIELPPRQDDRAAASSQRPDVQEMQQDLAGATADLMTQKTPLRANIAVLKSTDRMVGTLLDIVA